MCDITDDNTITGKVFCSILLPLTVLCNMLSNHCHNSRGHSISYENIQ